MQRPRRATSRTQPSTSTGQSGAARARVLVLESDGLTRWSITTYLCRWFSVDTVDSLAAAHDHLAAQPFAALLLSDELSTRDVEALQAAARRNNPAVMTVRMVSGATDAVPAQRHTLQLEKPFELAKLARLLGISEPESSSR